MPELPEVETMVRGIRPHCTLRTIERIEFLRNRPKSISISPDAEEFTRRISGRCLTGVSRLAKRILMKLDSGDVMVVEPRMTGLLVISDPPTLNHRRVVWHFQKADGLVDQLEFWDRRGLGTLTLYDPASLQQLRSRLGPDALEMTASEWKRRLKATTREIKVAMLDQTMVAGIGNLYASEILHRSGISPHRNASTLSSRQLEKLNEATQYILNEAIRYEGSTLNDGTYRNALSQDGSYQNLHRVYQRADELCPTCGQGTVQRVVQAQRATFFCDRCQK